MECTAETSESKEATQQRPHADALYAEICRDTCVRSLNITCSPLLDRYTDVGTLERTRVNLSTGEYINANHVHLLDRHFILGQAPVRHAFATFWRTIWEHDCAEIVMLTSLVESNVEKADCYWPVNSDAPLCVEEFRVELKRVYEREPGLLVRELLLRQGRAERAVTLFQDMRWIDHGCPAHEIIAPLLRAVDERRLDSAPIFVHCSAGIGRSGVFTILCALFSKPRPISVESLCQTIKSLRQQRAGAVQNCAQFQFLLNYLT